MLAVLSADLVVTAALSHLISQLFNISGLTLAYMAVGETQHVNS